MPRHWRRSKRQTTPGYCSPSLPISTGSLTPKANSPTSESGVNPIHIVIGSSIGRTRLFCLDCVHKMTGVFNSLDIFCVLQCIVPSITRHEDLKSAHEPNHKLVKARIPVLLRQHGCIDIVACKGLKRIGSPSARILESSAHLLEEERGDWTG